MKSGISLIVTTSQASPQPFKSPVGVDATGAFVGALEGVTGGLVGATGALVGALEGVTGGLVGATGDLVGALEGVTGDLVGEFVGDGSGSMGETVGSSVMVT